MTHRQPSCLEAALPEAISWIRKEMSAPNEMTFATVTLAWVRALSQIRTIVSIPDDLIPIPLISFVWH